MPVTAISSSSSYRSSTVAETFAPTATASTAVREFQTPSATDAPAERMAVDPEAQAATRRAFVDDAQTRMRESMLVAAVPKSGTASIDLPAGYGSLEKLGAQLPRLDGRYSSATPRGRATLAIALAIGGTEAFGRGVDRTDHFTRMGGTGNRMRGFAQFNIAYHDRATRTPERYASFVADIVNGKRPMPNSEPARDHAGALVEAVASGRVNNGEDLKRFLRQRGFGGSNWQGIDDGWGRTPGLGDALVRHVANGIH
jgi:hypothetical protein